MFKRGVYCSILKLLSFQILPQTCFKNHSRKETSRFLTEFSICNFPKICNLTPFPLSFMKIYGAFLGTRLKVLRLQIVNDDADDELFRGYGWLRKGVLDLFPAGTIVRFSTLQIPGTPRAELAPAQSLSSNFYEWIFFFSVRYFTSTVMVYNSDTVQNNILIKIELCSIDNHYTTGASLNGYSLCNRFFFSYIIY